MKFAKLMLCFCFAAAVSVVTIGCGEAANKATPPEKVQAKPTAKVTEGSNTATAPE